MSPPQMFKDSCSWVVWTQDQMYRKWIHWPVARHSQENPGEKKMFKNFSQDITRRSSGKNKNNILEMLKDDVSVHG